jgi:hypothetical protein
MARRVSVRPLLSPDADCVQDGSGTSSRRSSGRATPARGGARQAPQKRGLAQGRRPVRPATPDDDDDEGEGEEDEEESGSDEDASVAADGERGAKSRKSTLAKEATPLPTRRLTRRRTWIAL